MYTTLPGFDGDLTFEQARTIVHWFENVSTDDIDEALTLVSEDVEEVPDVALHQSAVRYVEQYRKAQARIERELSERSEVMTKIKEACALAGVRTPPFKPDQALIVLIRIQTTINSMWLDLPEEDKADKADQLVSEVRDILLEATEEFCDA